MSEFWRDPIKDQILECVVEIFNMEGVELVRLNGLTNYINNHIANISIQDVKIIIKKLNGAGIINYEYELLCPHCKEVSYIIKPINGLSKICDTCTNIYTIQLNTTMFPNFNKNIKL